jgi:hypothetical protein
MPQEKKIIDSACIIYTGVNMSPLVLCWSWDLVMQYMVLCLLWEVGSGVVHDYPHLMVGVQWFVCCQNASSKAHPMQARCQCSRLKPSYEFHFEGLSTFRPSVEGLVQIQDVNSRNIEMNHKTHIKLVHE